MRHTVLILVSDVECVEMIRTALQSNIDYDLIFASNPENFKLMEEEIGHIDLLLMDLEFPTLDSGIRLLRSFRNTKKTKDIPLIVICSQEEQQAKIRAIEANAVDIIPRSFSTQRLISSLDHVLKKTTINGYVLSQRPSIRFSPAEYVSREMQIAQRMASVLSFIVIMPQDRETLYEGVLDVKETSLDYRLMEESCQLLRATDVAFVNDNGDLIVVLPATGKMGALRAKEKIVDRLRAFLKTQGMSLDEQFYISVVTYPEDGDSMSGLMEPVLREKRQKEQLKRQTEVLDKKLSKATIAYAKNKRYIF